MAPSHRPDKHGVIADPDDRINAYKLVNLRCTRMCRFDVLYQTMTREETPSSKKYFNFSLLYTLHFRSDLICKNV